MYLHAASPSVTQDIARIAGSFLRAGDLVVLAGEMGAGKTFLAQGICAALGVTEPVTSPTFNLVHSYDAPDGAVYHADLYRLSHTDEIADLALDELASRGGIVLIEWGDVGDDVIGDHLEIRLAHGDTDDERDIALRAVGSRWELRWPRLVEAVKHHKSSDELWAD